MHPISDLVIRAMNLKRVWKHYISGKVGWKDDVTIVRLHDSRLKKLGLNAKYNSKKAIQATIGSLLGDSPMKIS